MGEGACSTSGDCKAGLVCSNGSCGVLGAGFSHGDACCSQEGNVPEATLVPPAAHGGSHSLTMNLTDGNVTVIPLKRVFPEGEAPEDSDTM